MRILPRRSLVPALAAAVIVVTAVALIGAGVVELPGGSGPDAVSRPDGATDVAATRVASLPLPETKPGPATGPPPTGLRMVRVATLENPISVADPDGAGPLLVATKDGLILAVDPDDGGATEVADLGERVSHGSEQGLLSIALSPTEHRLFANFTDEAGDTRVVSWPFSAPQSLDLDADSVHLRIDQPFTNHNGGNLVFGPDGALWIGTGDGGSGGDPDGNGQSTATLLGKMLRVSPLDAGGVAAVTGNRFVRSGRPAPGGRPEIWGVGLRNPWRYSFDRVTHRLWVADVGQDEFEEVDVIDPEEPQPNFGWNLLEGRSPYDGTTGPGLTAPVVVYDHDDGCSVTGGYVYRGTRIPALAGWYVYSDYCSGWIRAVPSDRPTARPVELVAGGANVLSFAELDDGELLVCAADGLYRLAAA